jgi:hypothetical protein
VLIFVGMTLEFHKSGRTCHGNRSIVTKPGVSCRLWVMNLKNSDIRTQTLPTQDSAPALKQILRKDAACSHLCVKCVCIVWVQSVCPLVCVVSLGICVCVFDVSMCVEAGGGESCQCTLQQDCVRPRVCARLCVKCVCP